MKDRILILTFLIWTTPIYPIIGIMGALDEEISLLKGEMKVIEVDTIAHRIFYSGSIGDKEIVLVKAGVGKVNAALTSQILIDKFKVNTIIFTGIAGAINPNLNPGDIVISTRLSYHDFGTITDKGFLPDSFFIFPDSGLVEIAKKVAERISLDTIPQEVTGRKTILPTIFLGTIVTGDQFIASEDKRKWLEETFDAYATEMEGAAVAHVCQVNEIPFVIIRSMSDLANEEARVEIEKFTPYAARNSALIVRAMINELSKMPHR